MKSIIIERVNNGWIVSPRSSDPFVGAATSNAYVYQTVEQLQKDLPVLLDEVKLHPGVYDNDPEAKVWTTLDKSP